MSSVYSSTALRLLLKEAYSTSKSVNLYGFSIDTKISPVELGRVISDLEERGLISMVGLNLMLTERGRYWIHSNRKMLFHVENQYWKKIPDAAIKPDASSGVDGSNRPTRRSRLDARERLD